MKLIFCIVLFLISCNTLALAQIHVWKKDVGRMLSFTETKTKNNKSLLVAELLQAATSRQVQAYQNIDAYFTFKLTIDKIQDIIRNKPDTITVVDPVTGKESIVITDRVFNPEAIDKFKLHEEWIFDPNSFQTTIQTVGIAPGVDIYNEDGSYRATQPLLWFKYSDAINIISNHTGGHLLDSIWRDNMKMNHCKSNIHNTGIVCRMINIATTEDSIVRHLRDISLDTTYIEMLMNKVKNGTITAYRDSNFTMAYSTDDFYKLFESDADTVAVADPVTGKEVIKIVQREFDPYSIGKYKLVERWTNDPLKGITEISELAIGPVINWDVTNTNADHYTPKFWIKFDDFKTILPGYEVYHPQNTFADKVWQSYFETPEYVR